MCTPGVGIPLAARFAKRRRCVFRHARAKEWDERRTKENFLFDRLRRKPREISLVILLTPVSAPTPVLVYTHTLARLLARPCRKCIPMSRATRKKQNTCTNRSPIVERPLCLFGIFNIFFLRLFCPTTFIVSHLYFGRLMFKWRLLVDGHCLPISLLNWGDCGHWP